MNKDFLKKELITAMKKKDSIKKECLQILLSSIQNMEIAAKKELNEDEINKLISKEIKQLNDTINLSGNRDTTVYEKKIKYLTQFLPAQISEDEVYNIIVVACNGMTNKGQIMKTVIPILHGRTDNMTLSKMVNKFLNN